MHPEPRSEPITVLRTIDALADRFEAAWMEDALPRIEDFLAEATPDMRPRRLPELLAIELEWRTAREIPCDQSEYLERFPEDAELVSSVFQDWSRTGSERPVVQPEKEAETGDAGRTTAVVSRGADSSVSVAGTHIASGGPAPDQGMPERVGRYRIVKPLGAGAMGSVYLARDEELHRDVALKVPRQSAGENRELAERFQREARAAATLQHPNICPVYDIGESDGIRYITMAYLQGRPLQAIARSGRVLPERQVAVLVRKLALALEVAHQAGVVHRDLKPMNIMIEKRGEPVIMDFGLALLVNREDDARITQSGMLVGSPAYMSPDQVSGEPNAVGPASDVYSLGVIFYELLTGRLPYQGGTMAVIGQILTSAPPTIRSLRPDVDPALEAIVARMMARTPAVRYASMRAVADDLSDWLKGKRSLVNGRASDTPEGQAAAPLSPDDSLAAIARLEEAPRVNRRKPSKRTSRQVWSSRNAWIAVAVLVPILLLAAVIVVRTSAGDVRIEVGDPRIAVEVDGERITLTDQRWSGRKGTGKHRLGVLVNGIAVPVGSAVPINVDGRAHQLVASLGDLRLSGSEFEIMRGTATALKIRLEPAPIPPRATIQEETAAPESTIRKPAEAARPAQQPEPSVAFRNLVEPVPAFEDHFRGDYLLDTDRSWHRQLEDGRLTIASKLINGFLSRGGVLTEIDEGLVEVETRIVGSGASWWIGLINPRIESQLYLFIEDGALRIFTRIPQAGSNLIATVTLTADPPLRTDGEFDRLQLLFRRRSLQIAVNGREIGPAVDIPFNIVPGELHLGIRGRADEGNRVEYERVAYYPLLGSVKPGSGVPTSAPARIAKAGEEIDLLTVTSLEEMYRNGPWERSGVGLHCRSHQNVRCLLELPVRPLEGYDLEVDFTSAGEPNFTIRLPLGDTGLAADYTVAAWGGKGMGIVVRHLGIMQLPEPMGRRPAPVETGKRHTATARVRRTETGWRIVGLVDGEELVHWEGNPVELSLHPAWKSPDPGRPTVGQ